MFFSYNKNVIICVARVGLIEFHFFITALGCATPARPLHGYVQRSGDTALVACNYTQSSWRLKCKDGVWDSTPGNCTAGVMSASLQSGAGIDLSSINISEYLTLCIL